MEIKGDLHNYIICFDNVLPKEIFFNFKKICKEYIKYQSQLKPHLRYENTIERAQQRWGLEKFHLDKRLKNAKDKERKIDQQLLARRNKE